MCPVIFGGLAVPSSQSRLERGGRCLNYNKFVIFRDFFKFYKINIYMTF